MVQKRRRRRRRRKIQVLKCIVFLGIIVFISCMGVYFYRIYKDTQLQNMVDQTVENGDMMGTLQKMSNYDSRIKDIIENQDQYPKELLELLTANIETIEFVFDYPEKKDNLPATIVEEAKSGEIPLLLQWDERWGYQNYGDGMITDIGSHFGIQGREISLDKDNIQTELESGHPIICAMRPGDFTTTGHFIVLTGMKDGKICVHDPNSKKRSEKLWDYETLEGQINNLWSFTTLF